MSKRRRSLMEFMRDKNLLGQQPGASQEDLRRETENGALVCEIEGTAKVVKQAAGALMVDMHSFLWPEPLVRSFPVQKGREEHRMQLELWNEKLILRFLTHWAHGTIMACYLPRVLAHWMGLHEVEVTMNWAACVSPERVHAREVEGWFVYLLSGFDRAMKPTFSSEPEKELVGAAVGEVSVRKALAIEEVL
jgi:hypothetical protein